MKIYLDFDDTIVNSIETLTNIVNERYFKNIAPKDIGEWDFSDVYPDIPLDDIVKIFGEQEFFNDIELKDYALIAIHKLSKRNDVTIVSKVTPEAFRRKNDWIRDNLEALGINISFIGVPINESKSIVDMSDGVIVDDKVSFLEETNAKYKIFFNNHRKFDIKQSEDWDGIEVDNWKDLYDELADIIRKEKGITNGKI